MSIPQCLPIGGAPEIFRLRRPPFLDPRTSGVLIGLFAAALLLPSLTPDGGAANGSQADAFSYFVIGLLWAFSLAFLAGRWLTRPRGPLEICLDNDGLTLPRHAYTARSERVEYADIESIDVRFAGKRRLLLVKSTRRFFWYPARAFLDCDVTDVVAAVRARILRSGTGAAQWARIEAQRSLATAAMGSRPAASLTLLAVIAVVFLVENLAGALRDPFALINFGANVPVLVREGQWFRLFSANFLHLNLLHFYFNALALFIFGIMIERLLGSANFLLVFLGACFGGALLSCIVSPAVLSAGASTGLFGLLGSLAYLHLRHRACLPAGFRQSRKWWIIILGLNGALPFLVPQIDWAAHAGGFVAGMLITMQLTRRVTDESPQVVVAQWKSVRPRVRQLTLAACLLFAASGIAALQHGLFKPDQDLGLVAQAYSNDASLSGPLRNNLAWTIVTTDRYSDLLPVALDLMAPIEARLDTIRDDREHATYLDTIASIKYRLGRHDEAIADARVVLQLEPSPFPRSQLSRFVWARNAARGPLLRGDARPGDIELHVSSTAGRDRGGMRFELRQTRSYQRWASVFVHVVYRDRRLGFFGCALAPGDAAQVARAIDVDQGIAAGDLRLVLGFVDPTGDLVHPSWRGCSYFAVDGLERIPPG